jgi:CheY-like chemotaxis protein
MILIVDDEPGMLKLFADLAERLDCDVIRADGGAMALDVLDQETPDLLILDLAMPEVSGFDVLRYVRSIPRLDAMKVMILTARPSTIPEAEVLGINYWVTKPVLPSDFIDAVARALDDL